MDRAVLAATDDCLRTGTVGNARLKDLRDHFDDAATLELITAIATWSIVSTVLRSTAIPLEQRLSPWPPDGQQPLRAGP